MKNFLSEFFDIRSGENFGNDIFTVLKKNIDFNSAKIYYTNPKKVKYLYGEDFSGEVLTQDLKYRNTKFGEIEIYSNHFSQKDKSDFEICARIISNILKDDEISKVMKSQVQALQQGYLDKKHSDEVKTKFISHVSHELRTPLNSILGYSDLLSNEFAGKLNAKQKEFISDIKVAGLNLLSMINEILDMSKIESNSVSVSITEFPISRLVLEIKNVIQPLLLKKQLNLITDVDDFNIETDEQKLKAILFNLLSNAVKYTNEQGVIKLSAKHIDIDKSYLFIVEDNGIGIPKDFQSKIFDKFVQVNENAENSTGLGLAIVYDYVKLLKGKINVESEPGVGSKFTVEL